MSEPGAPEPESKAEPEPGSPEALDPSSARGGGAAPPEPGDRPGDVRPTVTLRESAVLVPLYRDAEGGLRVVLVRRREGGLHGGQLAFPGGKREPEDRTLEETAVREACEETGMPADGIEVITALPAIDTMTTRFRIAPFLARIVRPPVWRPHPDEIAEILEERITDLGRPQARGQEVRQFPTWPEPRTIHYFHVGPYKLWGATYRILSPLLPRLIAGEWRV